MDQVDIAAGASLSGEVRKAISSATTMVVLVSSSSASSEGVQFELGVAEALNKPIVPVLIPGESMEAVPEHLKHLQIIDGNRMPLVDIASFIASSTSSYRSD